VLKDLETVHKRLDRARKASKGPNPLEKKAVMVCEALAAHLDQGQPARLFDVGDGDDEKLIVRDLFLITAKPMFYVCNVKEEQIESADSDPFVQQVKKIADSVGAPTVVISAAIEAEIMQLAEEERADFLTSIGLEEPGLHSVIQTGYRMLDLITYFTCGQPEVHAWTITKGTKAPQAAGKIHTDFEKGFIRAEVIKCADMLELGSEQAVKAAGKMRLEGKEYVVEDGDIMHFRFNV